MFKKGDKVRAIKPITEYQLRSIGIEFFDEETKSVSSGEIQTVRKHSGDSISFEEGLFIYDAGWFEEVKNYCTWVSDEDGIWRTECGETFMSSDNNMKYCCYCGKKLKEETRC